MSIETDIERSILLADFGDTFTKADTSTFQAIFENAFVEVGGAMRSVESVKPIILCRASDVSDLAHDAVLTKGAVTYHVIGIEPDGTGFTQLILEVQ